MASGWDDDTGEPRVNARDLYERASSQWMTEAWQEFCAKVKIDPEHERISRFNPNSFVTGMGRKPSLLQ